MRTIIISLACALAVAAPALAAGPCIDCHAEATPQIVSDWSLSEHSRNDVGCSFCHGDGHTSADDVDKVSLPTPDTCAPCHDDC